MATIPLPTEFKEFLQLLNSNDVEYLLVGGYCVLYYGYPRATGDIDIMPRKLVATFDSEAQLLAYVGWATLSKGDDSASKFEQGSALAGYRGWEKFATPLTDDDAIQVVHNPSPSML
jgi:hypothetical protein